MKIVEAVERLKKGKKIKRQNWKNAYYVMENQVTYMVCNGFICKTSVFPFEEVLAEDWVECDE